MRGLRAGAGTDCCFRVVAESGAGASQLLTVDLSFVPRTPYDKPSAPRGPLEVSDVTRSSVTLSWLAPTLNDGAAIMAYVIERPEHLSPTWTRVARVQPQTTIDTVGNLAERTVYHLRVGAENVEGTGPPRTLAAVAQFLCTLPAVTCLVSAKNILRVNCR